MERRRVTGPLSSDLPQKIKIKNQIEKIKVPIHIHSGEGRAGSV
jgi:hypothetical protein